MVTSSIPNAVDLAVLSYLLDRHPVSGEGVDCDATADQIAEGIGVPVADVRQSIWELSGHANGGPICLTPAVAFHPLGEEAPLPHGVVKVWRTALTYVPDALGRNPC